MSVSDVSAFDNRALTPMFHGARKEPGAELAATPYAVRFIVRLGFSA
jgi:hypothetical protein